MKILYLTPGVFDKGGISRYSRYQITALRERNGVGSVTVFSLFGPGATPYEFETYFNVSWFAGRADFLSRVKFAIRVLSISLFCKYDVVLVAHVNLSPLGTLAAILAQARSVTNVYGMEVWSGLTRVRRKSLVHQSLVISDCQNTADYVTAVIKREKKIAVVWDPVDTTRFRPLPQKLELLRKFHVPAGSNEKYMMTICRLSKGARHKGVYRTIALFAKHFCGRDFHYLIGGDGDDKDFLMNLARENGIDKQVHFLGSLPEDELPDYYNLCDLFVMLSEIGPAKGEGIPMTPMEAAACGKPILVGNQDGSREIINDGEGGYVLDPFDNKAIAGRIEEILTNSARAAELGAQAVQRMRDKFSYEAFFSRTIQALEKL